MAIQQCSYAFRQSSHLESDSSSGTLTPLQRSSCCRVKQAKISPREPDKDSYKLPFVTRSSSTTGQVTISVSLAGERRAKKPPPVSLKGKNTLFLPPIQTNHSKSKKLPKKSRVTFKSRKTALDSTKRLAAKPTEKSAQPTRILTRKFTVHYFPQETVEVVIERNSRLKNDGITYAKLKHSTATSLRIELTSLNFFGIFLGPLGSPKELCIDDAAIPDSIHEVCFQRLVLISQAEEKFYLSKDDRALGLIFWELKDQYDRSQLIPLPSREKSIEMERLLSCSNYSIAIKKRFVDLLLGLPSFYWTYYHKANYCMLQNSIWPNDYTTCKGTMVHVVPGREELIFLDISGEVEIESFPLHRIRSLTLRNVPVMSIDFEIVLVMKNRSLSHFISVITDCNKFIYSISIFMLRILQSQDMSHKILPPLDPYIADYIKIQNEPTDSTKHIILCSGEETAIAFDRIDLTDSDKDKKFRNRYCFRGPVYFKSKNCFSFWEPCMDSSDEEEFPGGGSDSQSANGEEQREISLSEMESINDISASPDKPNSSEHKSMLDLLKLKLEEKCDRNSSEEEDDAYNDLAADELMEDEEMRCSSQDSESVLEDDVFYSDNEELPSMTDKIQPWI